MATPSFSNRKPTVPKGHMVVAHHSTATCQTQKAGQADLSASNGRLNQGTVIYPDTQFRQNIAPERRGLPDLQYTVSTSLHPWPKEKKEGAQAALDEKNTTPGQVGRLE